MTRTNVQFESDAARRVAVDCSAKSQSADTRGTGHSVRTVGVNTLYQIGAQVAPAVAAIAAIPVLLRHLGPEAYGIVTLFSTALIYFAMLDLGLGRATTRFVAQSLESGRSEDVSRYFWSSLLLLTCTGLVVSLCFFFAVPVLVSHSLKIGPAYSRTAIESFYLISATIPIVTLTAAFRGFLEAAGRFPFLSLVTASTGAGMYIVPMLVVILGRGLVSVAFTYVALRVGMAIAFGIACFSTNNAPSLRLRLDWKALQKMVRFGGWLSLSNVIGTAMVYGDRFLLGSLVGMLAVTSYSMPLDVIGRLQTLVSSFCTVLFPVLSRLDGAGSARFQSVYRGANAIVLSFVTPLMVAAILLSPFVMEFWLRKHNTPEAVYAAQVFLAGSIVQAMASISFTALHARGRSDLPAWVHMAEFPLYCGAFYLAATHYGVRGAALVWFGRMILDFASMVILLKVQEKRLRLLVAPELAAIVISVVVLILAALRPANTLLFGVTICLLTWLWTWRKVLDSDTRKHLVRATISPAGTFSWLVGASRVR